LFENRTRVLRCDSTGKIPDRRRSGFEKYFHFLSKNGSLIPHRRCRSGSQGAPVTAATYPVAIAATIAVPLTSPAVALVQAQYPGGNFPSYDQAVGALGTDAIFACTARFANELASEFVPTFAYEFNDRNAPQNFLPPVTFPYGAAHASEIQYIFPFANPSQVGLKLPQTPLNANQQVLSDKMVGYWTRFARAGDPNGNGEPQWPQFTRGRQATQSLLPPAPATELDFATVHQCAFWDQLTNRTVVAHR
jgi:para-nitrobenzyl esterase